MTAHRTLRRHAIAAAMLSSSAAFTHHMGAPAHFALGTSRGAHPSVTAIPARLAHQPRQPRRAGRALLGLRASSLPGNEEPEANGPEQKGGAAAQARFPPTRCLETDLESFYLESPICDPLRTEIGGFHTRSSNSGSRQEAASIELQYFGSFGWLVVPLRHQAGASLVTDA